MRLNPLGRNEDITFYRLAIQNHKEKNIKLNSYVT